MLVLCEQNSMAQRIDPVDASVLTLRQAVTYRDTGTQHPQLVALRSLKDPTLQPVFEGLLHAKMARMPSGLRSPSPRHSVIATV